MLSLDRNQFSGPIPPALGRLGSLRWLYLADNQLTGAIPPEFGGLSNLRALRLYTNQLSGEIPSELAGLANLEYLFLGSNNRYTGCIPDGLRDVRENDFSWLDLPFCGNR